jgi:hypothetical protein
MPFIRKLAAADFHRTYLRSSRDPHNAEVAGRELGGDSGRGLGEEGTRGQTGRSPSLNKRVSATLNVPLSPPSRICSPVPSITHVPLHR